MAIAVDTQKDLGNAFATSLTTSYTCSGSDRILFVGGWGDTGSDNWTGVTYNGVSMTRIASTRYAGNSRYNYLYYLLAPATGANNIVISANNSGGIEGVAASYTGVNQSGQPDASATQNSAGGTVSTQTTTLTTVADNCWLIMMVHGMATAGASTTLRIASANNANIFDSNAAKTPAGSYGLTSTNVGATDYGSVMASFKPVSATPTNTSSGFFSLTR